MKIMPTFKIYSFALFVIGLSLFSNLSNAQTLNASVDRSQISVDETLTLTVRYTGSKNGQPDFSAVSEQFEILNQQQSNQIRSINGRVESFTEWSMVIIPRATGRLIIPSFKFDNIFSDAIEINVTESTPVPSGQTDIVFLETVIDTRPSYVQQQINLSYRFFYSVNIDGLDRSHPQVDGAIIEPLEEASYRRNLNGKPYNVAEFNYAIFPQTSGKLEIPSLNWTAKIVQGTRSNSWIYGNGRYELKRLKSEAATIEILPQPNEYPADKTWLPSTNITLEEHWNADPNNFKVGEPITRTITIVADGQMSSQLPSFIEEPTDTRLKYYLNQPTLSEEKSTNSVSAKRTETFAIVVSEGGEIQIPEIKIPWWDVTEKKLRYATIPASRVIAASNGVIEQNIQAREDALIPPALEQNMINAPQNTESNLLWKITSLFFAVTAVLFFSLWINLKRNTRVTIGKTKNNASKSHHSNKWKKLELACKNSDLSIVRECVLLWGQEQWPNSNIHALNDIARHCSDSAVSLQLETLDKALFHSEKSHNWKAELLLDALKEWKKMTTKETNKQKNDLGPLYS